MRQRRSSIKRKIGFGILTVAGVFILLEILLAALGIRTEQHEFTPFVTDQRANQDLYTPDPDLFWRLRPGKQTGVNKAALRGALPAKPKNRLRVLCLGDSITFGFRLKPEQTFPARLEQMWGDNVEVLNAGVTGYTIVQGYRFFKRDLAQLEPDLVLVEFGFNEAKEAYLPDTEQWKMPNLIWYINRALSEFRIYALLVKGISQNDPDHYSRVSRETYESYCLKLDQLIREKKSNGVFLILPHYDRKTGLVTYPFGVAPKTVKILDLVPYYNAMSREMLNKLFIDFIHPSEKGARALATLVGEKLVAENMIPDKLTASNETD